MHHRTDRIAHSLCYTSRGALDGTRNTVTRISSKRPVTSQVMCRPIVLPVQPTSTEGIRTTYLHYEFLRALPTELMAKFFHERGKLEKIMILTREGQNRHAR